MAKFIALVDRIGNTVYLNPDAVKYTMKDSQGFKIYTDGKFYIGVSEEVHGRFIQDSWSGS